jgi:hypothetical protein
MMTTLSPYAGSGYPTTNTAANPEYRANQTNNMQSTVNQNLNQQAIDARRLSISPTSYNWSPQNTTNSATQNNNMLSNQNLNQTQNQFLKLNQTYSPTSYNNLTYNPQTATQNTTNNNSLNQLLKQNNTVNTQNNLTNNNTKVVYNYITNRFELHQAPQPQPVPCPPTPTPPNPVICPPPEPPKQGGGDNTMLYIGLAVALGIGGFFLFGNKGEDKKVDASASANANANANASTSVVTTDNPRPAEPPPLKPDVHYRRRRKEEPPTHGKQPGSNTYHIYGDPFIRVNGGKEVESLGGIPEKGGTKEILLGDTDEGTKVSATYVRSFVDNEHGKPMESIKDLTLTFADGKAIGINTNAKGTTVNVRGKHYDISKDGEYTSGDHCISVKNKVVTITTVGSAEVYTINLGQYTEHENQTKLGPNYLELKAQKIRDFKTGEFNGAEKPSTGAEITSEDSESSYSMRLDNNRRSYAVPVEW